MQATSWPNRIDASRLVVLVPTPTFLNPNGMSDPLLAVGVEFISDVLFGRDGAYVFGLHLFDELHGVQGDIIQRTHDGAVFYGPVWADEGEEVGKFRDCEAEVAC